MDVLLVQLGTRERFGIPVDRVQEVITCPPLVRGPRMPTGSIGLLSLRGDIVPVWDLPMMSGWGRSLTPDDGSGFLVVLNHRHQPASQAAMRVVAVDRIVPLDPNRLADPQRTIGIPEPRLQGIVQHDDGLVSVVNLDVLFPSLSA